MMMKGADNNVYTQIGITLLIGLASKNAILIVEFSMAEREKGKSLMDAAKLRFRPILMTSIASIAGFMPLFVASGAGAASQQAIGLAVVGGDGCGNRHVVDVYTGVLCRDEAIWREAGNGCCCRGLIQ